ncbi:MAG: hypothetical protein PHS44_07840 [Candidatus Dojkabacteria bacterium]|nr:hypothetical protein [Candidatus Dojkabacteria bacterium]
MIDSGDIVATIEQYAASKVRVDFAGAFSMVRTTGEYFPLWRNNGEVLPVLYERSREIIDCLSARLPVWRTGNRPVVLECGMGTGMVAAVLSAAGGKVIGIEASEQRVLAARRYWTDLETAGAVCPGSLVAAVGSYYFREYSEPAWKELLLSNSLFFDDDGSGRIVDVGFSNGLGIGVSVLQRWMDSMLGLQTPLAYYTRTNGGRRTILDVDMVYCYPDDFIFPIAFPNQMGAMLRPGAMLLLARNADTSAARGRLETNGFGLVKEESFLEVWERLN